MMDKGLLSIETLDEKDKHPKLFIKSGDTPTDHKPIRKPDFSISQTPSIISKMEEFLPKLQQSNIELQKKITDSMDPHQFDIQHVGVSEDNHIEMNLAMILEKQAAEEMKLRFGQDLAVEEINTNK